jgi:hypothetical protein
LLALLSVPVAIAILILFAHEEFMLSVIFHVIALSILLCFRFRRDLVIPVILGYFLGPIAEALCVEGGLWSYAPSTTHLIPLWLPPLWGLAALGLTMLSKWLSSPSRR